MRIKTTAALLGLAAAVSLATVSATSAAIAGYEVLTRPDYGNEGTLLRAPAGGPDPQLLRHVEPGVMSIVFTDRRMAEELYDEAAANGERVCLADLGPQPQRAHGQRWWLFTC